MQAAAEKLYSLWDAADQEGPAGLCPSLPPQEGQDLGTLIYRSTLPLYQEDLSFLLSARDYRNGRYRPRLEDAI